MTQDTRTNTGFEYYLEDVYCVDCLHNRQKGKIHGNGCLEQICRYADIRHDAIKNKRINREKGALRYAL